MDKPLIAVVNSWNEIVPGCIHLPAVAQSVREGILEAGGVPLEFNTIGVCDGMAQGHVGMKYSLPSRGDHRGIHRDHAAGASIRRGGVHQ